MKAYLLKVIREFMEVLVVRKESKGLSAFIGCK